VPGLRGSRLTAVPYRLVWSTFLARATSFGVNVLTSSGVAVAGNRYRRIRMRLLPDSQPTSTVGPASAAGGCVTLYPILPSSVTGAAPFGCTVALNVFASASVVDTASVRSG